MNVQPEGRWSGLNVQVPGYGRPVSADTNRDVVPWLSDDEQHFDLPMPRADIADHLGLTIETVSRTLSQFARDGLIHLPAASRSVVLRNRTALRTLDS